MKKRTIFSIFRHDASRKTRIPFAHLLPLLLLFVFSTAIFVIANRVQQGRFDLRGRASESPYPSVPKPTPNGNPFGVMISAQGLDTNERIAAAKKLGAVYFRPNSVFVTTWNGACADCTAATNAGLKLLLTVRNNGGQQKPTTPPTDLNSYKKTIGSIVDALKPTILVIENEENSETLFYTGTPQQYHQELKAACEVAHSKKIKCTNGGLVSSLVALLVADSYNKAGQKDKAVEYLNRTLGSKLAQQFGTDDPQRVFQNPKAKQQIEKGLALLSGYKAAGADYVNFHWYIADTPALGEAVDYLKKATGLPAMTNEVGQQKTEDPKQVTAVMQKIKDLGLPYAVWFSIDIPGYGQARGLVDGNGNLRPNGQAFKAFIEANY